VNKDRWILAEARQFGQWLSVSAKASNVDPTTQGLLYQVLGWLRKSKFPSKAMLDFAGDVAKLHGLPKPPKCPFGRGEGPAQVAVTRARERLSRMVSLG